jgi:hypothetical protein
MRAIGLRGFEEGVEGIEVWSHEQVMKGKNKNEDRQAGGISGY